MEAIVDLIADLSVLLTCVVFMFFVIRNTWQDQAQVYRTAIKKAIRETADKVSQGVVWIIVVLVCANSILNAYNRWGFFWVLGILSLPFVLIAGVFPVVLIYRRWRSQSRDFQVEDSRGSVI